MANMPMLEISNATILFRNFAGEARPPYNAAGSRNFAVVIDPQTAESLRADGWNVRTVKSKDEELPPQEILTIRINTDSNFPPRIYLVHSPADGARPKPNLLSPEEYNILDFARFDNVDLQINPYIWQEKPQRVTGYLATGYFTLAPDKFRDRYFLAEDHA